MITKGSSREEINPSAGAEGHRQKKGVAMVLISSPWL